MGDRLWQLNWRLTVNSYLFLQAARLLGKRLFWALQSPDEFLYLLGETQKDGPYGTQSLLSLSLGDRTLYCVCISRHHSFPAAHCERSHWSQVYHLRKTFPNFKKKMASNFNLWIFLWLTYKGLKTEAEHGRVGMEILTAFWPYWCWQASTPLKLYRCKHESCTFEFLVGLLVRETAHILTSLEIPW